MRKTRTKLKQLELGLKRNQVIVSNGTGFELVIQDKNLTINIPDYVTSGLVNTNDEINSITLNQTTVNLTRDLRNPDDITPGLEKSVANNGSADIIMNLSVVASGTVAKFSWNGSVWKRVGSNPTIGVTISQEFVATASQNTFLISGTILTGAQIIMYINGVRVNPSAVGVTGNTVNYSSGFNNNYIIQVGDRVNMDVYVAYVASSNEFTTTANQTIFTLTQALATGTVAVAFINGIRIPVGAYTVSSTTFNYLPIGNNNYQLQLNDKFIINF
jgi:hypothetical protein